MMEEKDFDEANVIDERYQELEKRVKQRGEAAVAAQKPNEEGTAADMEAYAAAAAARSEAQTAAASNAAAAKEETRKTNEKNKDEEGAAAVKKKSKSTEDMLRPQDNENEKTHKGDDEIKRLIEERRSIKKETSSN